MGRAASITTDMFDYTFGPTRTEKFALLRRVGFRYVHWCDDWDNERFYSRRHMDDLAETLADAGLQCIDVHGTATRRARIDAPDAEGRARYLRLLKNRIAFCAAVGGDAVVVHPPGEGRMGFVGRDRLRRAVQAFDAARKLCDETGVRLAVENMGNRSGYSAKILEWFLDRYPPDFVGWCLDSGHSHQAGDFSHLQALGDRLIALHLHDNHGENDEHQPPFFGTIDWPSTMTWIKQTGYAKPINFEITHRTHLFDGTMQQYTRYARRAVVKAMSFFG